MRETAYAKINLALHIRARRDDGYHELETLFAFVDTGDVLTVRSALEDRLTMHGEFSSQLSDPFGNIISQALGVLPRCGGLAVDLDKRLPVAAGLGGGSADAGAIFRIVRAMHGLPDNWRNRAAKLGADVPACVDSITCIGRGTGADLHPIDNDMAGMHVLLVNPRVPLSTGPVFAAWDGTDRGALPEGSPARIAQDGRNELEAAAISLCPPIAKVLRALGGTGSWLTRMSGSGATCFALYRNCEVMRVASETLAANHPEWWQMQGTLR